MTSSDYVPLSKLGSFTKSGDYCHCICIYAFRNSLRSVLWDIFKSRKTAQLAGSYLAREALLGLCWAACLYANIHINQHTRNQISLKKRENVEDIFLQSSSRCQSAKVSGDFVQPEFGCVVDFFFSFQGWSSLCVRLNVLTWFPHVFVLLLWDALLCGLT